MENGLVNEDGAPFDADNIAGLVDQLAASDTATRTQLRDSNSEAIADHTSARMLIAAGPGTGKSFLFMARLSAWANRFAGQPIYVLSFVRKLTLDLKQRVESSDLSDDAKSNVTVSTLHTLARSVVERNGGTVTLPMAQHIRMIGEEWKDVVWGDVLHLASGDVIKPVADFESRYHDLRFTAEEPWPELHATYERLCRFYNALGFADSIVLAEQALTENPALNEHALWIFDEFQDFNTAEEKLVRTCMDGADSVLLAGDDDQAIYQSFKGSRPEIIRNWYRDPSIANAMLPLCDRSSYHICMGASTFLAQHDSAERIDKVFLPIDTDEGSSRIQVVVASKPWTAVAYVSEFIEQHKDQITARANEIRDGESDEPYLLVLSLNGDLGDYLGKSGSELVTEIEQWRLEEVGPGDDWKHILLYYLHHVHPLENFPLRKVLHLEGIKAETAATLVHVAIDSGVSLSEVEHEAISVARGKCRDVHEIVKDDSTSPAEKAEALMRLLRTDDPDRLVQDLEAFPIGQVPADDEEEVETARFVSPVEFMTMFRAKGLSADHVIVLGADATNMGHATPELFYVALTRARQSLHLVIPLEATGADRPHQFVLELPEDHCSYSKYLKTGSTSFDDRSTFVSYFDQRSYRIRHNRARSS